MSKRFTDTEKWGKAWFRKLKPVYKCAWVYLLDKCDHAGIWQEDFEAMSFNVGEEVDEASLIVALGGRIEKVDSDKFLITSFVDYQYGKLNPANKVHKSVIEKLSKIQGASEGLPSPFQGAKDKDKEKDKDKVKEKDKEVDLDSKLKPERLVELFNSKLAGVGNIKASPNFFLPSGLIEDFQKITGFPEFQKLETWESYFNMVASSEYFTKTWTPSLAWLLDPDNAFKVLSGQYQDGDKKEKPSEKIPEHLVASASAWAYRAYGEIKSSGEWYGDTDFDLDVLRAFGDVSEIRDSIPQTRNEIIQKLREAYYKASSGISKTA